MVRDVVCALVESLDALLECKKALVDVHRLAEPVGHDVVIALTAVAAVASAATAAADRPIILVLLFVVVLVLVAVLRLGTLPEIVSDLVGL